jgi:Mg2+/Co2+ transporter CorC
MKKIAKIILIILVAALTMSLFSCDIVETVKNGLFGVMEDVEEAIGVTLRGEEDAFDTIGGFVFAHLEYIPQDDETPEFTYQNLTVKVLTVKEKRIELTEIIKTEVTMEDEEAVAASSGEDGDPVSE